MGVDVHLDLAATCQLLLLCHFSCMHQSVRSKRHKVDIAVFCVWLVCPDATAASLGEGSSLQQL